MTKPPAQPIRAAHAMHSWGMALVVFAISMVCSIAVLLTDWRDPILSTVFTSRRTLQEPARWKLASPDDTAPALRLEAEGHLPLLVQRIIKQESQFNGFQRGRALASALPEGWQQRLRRAFGASQDWLKRAEPNAELDRLVEELFATNVTVDMREPNKPAQWLPDVLFETQGLSQGEGNTFAGALQRLQVASQIGHMIRVEAAALRVENELVVVASLHSDVLALNELLTPMLVTEDTNSAWMLTVGGISLPLCAVNSHGVALVRLHPRYVTPNYLPAYGYDSATEMRIFALRASEPGLELKPGETSVGRALQQFSDQDSRLISRLSTPGIVLACNRDYAWRYEWRSGGADLGSGLEFEAKALSDLPLLAGPDYRAPEHARDAMAGSLEARWAELKGDASPGSMEHLMQACVTEKGVAVALWPERGEAWYYVADQGMQKVRLNSARAQLPNPAQ